MAMFLFIDTKGVNHYTGYYETIRKTTETI
jgi:hypothetical protein